MSRQFRLQQTEHGGAVTPADKQALRQRLQALEEELNRHLAAQYSIDPKKPADYQKWKESHKPFHWFVDFYGIMSGGGFDVIIGNPPYVEYSKVKKEYVVREYVAESCGNLYSLVMERSFNLSLGEDLLTDLWKNATKRHRQRQGGAQQLEVNFNVGLSKPIIDEIDRVLAQHYGFTPEELDFIINYDIKYRMGDSLSEGDGS